MEKYKKYKNVDIEWLDSIPNHWKIKRNKSIFKEISKKSSDGKGELLTVSHITGVTLRSEKSVNMFMAENFEGYKVCEIGDLIINNMWAWMGALGVTKTKGICSPAYGVYRENKEIEINSSYFNFLFTTPMYIKEMTKYSKGIVSSRLRLYPKDFYQIETVVPPLKEQTQIANYLDVKTTAIDKKVKLLQQKITHYKAYRKTLINETVTKGLDKTVKLKDSGINWIGEIPEHWEVKKGKDCLIIKYGIPLDSRLFTNNPEKGFPMIRIRDLNKNRIQNYYEGEVLPSGLVDNGAILTGMDGDFNTVKWSSGKALLNQRICNIYPKGKGSKDFLFYYLPIVFKYINDIKHFTTVKHLSANDLNNLIVIYPSISEQQQIASYLDAKTSTIDKIVKNIETQIATLKELRKTLINEVVTGKVKVTSTSLSHKEKSKLPKV